MEESKYTIEEIVKLLNSVDDLKSKTEKLSKDKTELEHQLEYKYNDMKYVLIERQTLREIADALENSTSNHLSDIRDNINDIEDYTNNASYNLEDAESSINSCIEDIEHILMEVDPNDE